jgi:dTDP-4-amino-4,6-dideoxygalactose transaminase
MITTESNLALRKKLANYSNTDASDWYLCLKARYGMAAVYKAVFDVYGSSDVLTTPYTCITSVNPILVSYLKPIYADIDPTTLSITDAGKHLTKRTRAICVQHTLGIINPEMKKIAKLCKEKNLLLVEDSAHCLGRMAVNSKKEPIADISVHSFGVEKVLQNTKFGGAIYVNPALKKKDQKLYDKIVNHLLNLKEVPRSLDLKIKAYRGENAILQRIPNRMQNGFRNFLLKTKAYEPAVTPMEQRANQLPSYAITEFATEVALKHIGELSANYAKRAENVKIYQKYLQNAHDFHIVSDSEDPLLAFPIVFEDVRRATDAYVALAASGFFIRRWYSPLLYPGPTDNRKYEYNPKMAPVAELMHARVLCLPTNLTTTQTKKLISILLPVNKPVQKI